MARKRKRRFLRGLLYGWLAAYFLDPQLGRGRRALARDWGLSRGRRALRRSGRAGRYTRALAYGKTQALLHRREEPKPPPDDATLAHKVESIIFRDADVPKGQINVNVQEGVVQLRGEVPQPELIRDLVEKARRVAGVREVENLLHLPGTPPPMHQ
jgi:BON domain-containing protein